MPYPSAAILDTFNRADTGPPPSASWTTVTGYAGLVVASNQAAAAAADAAGLWNTVFAANQEVYCTLAVLPDEDHYLILAVRNQSATDFGDCYYAVFIRALAAADYVQIFKAVAGVFTQLGADITLGSELAANDVIGLRALGQDISVFRNGSLLGTRSDTEITGTGRLLLNQSGTASRVDNFGGGHVPSYPELERVGRGIGRGISMGAR